MFSVFCHEEHHSADCGLTRGLLTNLTNAEVLAGLGVMLCVSQFEEPSHENDPFHFSSPITAQIAVTPEYVGGFYKDYFLDLLDKGLLCMGLFRAQHCDLGNVDSFVSTNPAPHTILHEGDRAYVITHDKEALYANDVPTSTEGYAEPNVEAYVMPPSLLPDTHFKSSMKPAARMFHNIRKKANVLRKEVRGARTALLWCIR